MATAGRILIIPKGKYNEETQYEMLDMVSHGGKGWVCKKTCIGIAPEDGEYWAECINVSEEFDGVDAKINAVDARVTEEIDEINSNLETKMNMRSMSSSRSVLDKTLKDGQYFLANATDSPKSTMGYLTIQTYHDRETAYRKHTWKPYASEETYVNSLVDGTWLGWDSYAKNSDFTTVTALTSDVGTVSGGYVKVGKVVTVSARIKLTQNVVNNVTEIFKGLPTALFNYTALTTFNVDGGKNVDGCLVNQTSLKSSLVIRVDTDELGLLNSGRSFIISGSYISQD